MVWKVRCMRCGYSEDFDGWKPALALAIFHAQEFNHWKRVVLSRPVDVVGYVLTAYGTERRPLEKCA
jgi:hypothetical protein